MTRINFTQRGEKLGADFQNHLTINSQNPIKVSPGYETEARLQMGLQFSSNEVSIFREENHIKVTLFLTQFELYLIAIL